MPTLTIFFFLNLKIAYLKHVLKTRIECLISSPPHPQIIIQKNSYVIMNNPDFFPQTSMSNPSQRKWIISNFKLKNEELEPE
jgi:hypothetical protein